MQVLSEPPPQGAIDSGYARIALARGAAEPFAAPRELFEATIRDLSVNGARLVAAAVPPWLSRLSLSFELPAYGSALAVAIVMWRTTTRDEDGPGFGVLFEAVDLDVRNLIADMIERAHPGM